MDDFFNDFFAESPKRPPIASTGHGGYRPGAGRKTKEVEEESAEANKSFNAARARNEAAKADLNELEFQIKSKAYLPREAYVEASATAIQTFAQTCRTIPDELERKGVSPDVCEKVLAVLDAALADLANELHKFTEIEE